MTAIRNKSTGEWIYGGPQSEPTTAPQFLRLQTLTGPGHRYRTEHLVRIDAITYIESGSEGYELYINGRSGELLLQPYEYEHLISVLESAGLLTYPAPGSEEAEAWVG